MSAPDWEECKTCGGRELCHGKETLARHGMSCQTFYDLVARDADALAFSSGEPKNCSNSSD